MSNITTKQPDAVGTWSITTRRVATAGVLAALTIIISLVPFLGYINLGFSTATTEHIPTILGSVLEGPVVGLFTGLVFGITSWYNALTTVPTPLNAVFILAFRNPLVAILPRILIGLVAWLVFAGLKRINIDLAGFVAGFLGAAANTFFVVTLAIVLGYWPTSLALALLPQAAVEAIVSAIITLIVARAVYIVRGRLVRAPDTKPREELPY